MVTLYENHSRAIAEHILNSPRPTEKKRWMNLSETWSPSDPMVLTDTATRPQLNGWSHVYTKVLKLTPIECTSSSTTAVRNPSNSVWKESSGHPVTADKAGSLPLAQESSAGSLAAAHFLWQHIFIIFKTSTMLSNPADIRQQIQKPYMSPGWQMSCASSWVSPHFQPDKKTEEKTPGHWNEKKQLSNDQIAFVWVRNRNSASIWYFKREFCGKACFV